MLDLDVVASVVKKSYHDQGDSLVWTGPQWPLWRLLSRFAKKGCFSEFGASSLEKQESAVKQKGPGEEGAAGYCPKILLPKGPKCCSVLSIGVIREICTWNRPLSESEISGWFLVAPSSPGPLCFAAERRTIHKNRCKSWIWRVLENSPFLPGATLWSQKKKIPPLGVFREPTRESVGKWPRSLFLPVQARSCKERSGAGWDQDGPGWPPPRDLDVSETL